MNLKIQNPQKASSAWGNVSSSCSRLLFIQVESHKLSLYVIWSNLLPKAGLASKSDQVAQGLAQCMESPGINITHLLGALVPVFNRSHSEQFFCLISSQNHFCCKLGLFSFVLQAYTPKSSTVSSSKQPPFCS